MKNDGITVAATEHRHISLVIIIVRNRLQYKKFSYAVFLQNYIMFHIKATGKENPSAVTLVLALYHCGSCQKVAHMPSFRFMELFKFQILICSIFPSSIQIR